MRKSRFSSLAYDPALSVPAQKCKTGFSQFAYLGKKEVFQLVVFRLARKTVNPTCGVFRNYLACYYIWRFGDWERTIWVGKSKFRLILRRFHRKPYSNGIWIFFFSFFFSTGSLTIYIGQPQQNPIFFSFGSFKILLFYESNKTLSGRFLEYGGSSESMVGWFFYCFSSFKGWKKRTLEKCPLRKNLVN